MRKILLLTTFLAACSGGHPVPQSEQIRSLAMIHGKVATEADAWGYSVVEFAFPNGTGYETHCTGTLIDEKTVLSAAHCVRIVGGQVPDLLFHSLDGSGNYEVRKLQIGKIRYHDDFDKDYDEKNARDVYDIGLARFKGRLPKGFRPMKLLDEDSPLAKDKEILTAGFGETSARSHRGSGILRYKWVKITNTKYGKTEFLTDQSKGGSCHGDSGGPGLVVQNGEFALGAINNRGDPLCEEYHVMTRIPAFLDWIKQTQAELDKD